MVEKKLAQKKINDLESLKVEKKQEEKMLTKLYHSYVANKKVAVNTSANRSNNKNNGGSNKRTNKKK